MAGELSYSNPVSLFPKNDFVASGPLGGALAGLQTMYGTSGIQAQMRDQDLDYERNLIRKQLEEGKLPNEVAKSNLEGLAANYQLENPDLVQRTINAGVGGAEADTQNKVLKNDAARMLNASESLLDMYQVLKDYGGNDMAAQEPYKQLRQEAIRRGVNPAKLPEHYLRQSCNPQSQARFQLQ